MEVSGSPGSQAPRLDAPPICLVQSRRPRFDPGKTLVLSPSVRKVIPLLECLDKLQVFLACTNHFAVDEVLESDERQAADVLRVIDQRIHVKIADSPLVAKSHLSVQKCNNFYMILVAKLQRSDLLNSLPRAAAANHIEVVRWRNDTTNGERLTSKHGAIICLESQLSQKFDNLLRGELTLPMKNKFRTNLQVFSQIFATHFLNR